MKLKSTYRVFHGRSGILWGAVMAFAALSPSSSTAELIPLRAGNVSMVFDDENVFLRYIRVGKYEVLRGINAPIRDQNWSTVAPQVSNLVVESSTDSFRATFDVRCAASEIDFRWKGTIAGSAKGEIEFTFDGKAHSTFKRNRIGFCLLHGPHVAGRPWVIESANGQTSKGQFPKFISPHQPAKNLRAVTHEITDGIWARVEFEGEVFEMEDQRNWTDASFKTYCTPLELPYPVQVTQGTAISQKIKISLQGDLDDVAPQPTGSVLTLGRQVSPLPRLGLQLSSEASRLTNRQLERLKLLRLDHLRVDLPLSQDGFLQKLRRATQQANSLGISLHVGLILGDSPALKTLLKEVKVLQPPVSFWMVARGNPDHFGEILRLFESSRSAKLGVTRTTNFVDLNRERPGNPSIEAAGFAINPQIHAFDNASIIETLPIHADVVNSARQFIGDKPLVIGPITLAPQFVDGEDPPGGPPPGSLPTYVDVRQVDPMTAAWTLGSVKYLAEAGAHSATFYETVGWTGLMDIDDVSARPAAFPSSPGEVYPVYHLLKEIGEFAGGSVQQIHSSNELAAVGVALRLDSHMRVLIANLKDEPQTLALRGFLGKPLAVQVIGDGTRASASRDLQIELPPFGIGRFDRVVD